MNSASNRKNLNEKNKSGEKPKPNLRKKASKDLVMSHRVTKSGIQVPIGLLDRKSNRRTGNA